MSLPASGLHLYRHVKGHYDLMLLLAKWNRNYRRGLTVTAVVFCLLLWSVATWKTPADFITIALELGLLALQMGAEMSILPVDYRQAHDGVEYSAQLSTHVAWDELSFPMETILPNKIEESLGFGNPLLGWNLTAESPLASDNVDDILMTREVLRYEQKPKTGRFIRSHHQLRYLSIRVSNRQQHTTNGSKVELQDTAAALVGREPLPIRKAYYFDNLMTAEAFRSRLFRKNIAGEKEVYTDLTTYFPAAKEGPEGAEKLRFTPDFYQTVTQCIGVTTLLLTENRRVALLQQGKANAIGAGLVCLGGSGSMNYSDIEQTGNPEDFRTVITYALAREMCEETGLQDKWIEEVRGNTLLTGFFRWIDRCGHPEFIGITRAGAVPFSKKQAIDKDEVVSFSEIPVTINKVEDFRKVMDYVREKKIAINLSSLMALHRLTVIAGYGALNNDEAKRQIYRTVSDFIEGAGPEVLEDIYI